MKIRQSALQSKKFIAMLKDDCISLASSDVKYNGLSDSLKAKGEYQLLKKSLTNASNGIHQGIYIITSSGKLIKQIKWGWPTPKIDRMNAQLEQGIKDYKAMSRTERLGSVRLKKSDISMPAKKKITAAKGWLQLRNISRNYAFKDMNLFDVRHSAFTTVDKLWFSEEEKMSLVPDRQVKGTTEKIPQKVVVRMLLNSHLITGRSAWWAEHIKKFEMKMTVVSVDAKLVTIRYSGDFEMDANSEHCQEAYKGKLLGKAVWNKKEKQFSSLELVSLGKHTVNNLKPNMHRGNIKTVDVASKLKLDPQLKVEKGIAPANWPDYYTREMRANVQ